MEIKYWIETTTTSAGTVYTVKRSGMCPGYMHYLGSFPTLESAQDTIDAYIQWQGGKQIGS